MLELLIPAKPQSFTRNLKNISNEVYLLETLKDYFKMRGITLARFQFGLVNSAYAR